MRAYSLSHLSDRELLRDLAALVAQNRATTARLLAHLAECDARRLYLPAAYPSLFAYCVHELRLSEDAAYKRIQAARVARQFPGIFEAVADGRLHLTAVGLLAPYLTPENAAELLAAAARKTRSEIEELLARRFPRSETLGLLAALPSSSPARDPQLAPAQVEGPGRPDFPGTGDRELAPAQVAPRSKLAPVAPERFLLQVTIGRSTQEKLRYAQQLLGHALPCGDLAQVLDRALEALIEKLERRKFAATPRPRPSTRPSPDPRHIPAQVKRAVWERDGGQCTFTSDSGRRCPARTRLEFDHADPIARGGTATVERMRLRCRAHNQYAAECTFGAGFMSEKRREAQLAPRRVEARAAAVELPASIEPERDVIPWLRQLGFRADEARRAAAQCESIPEASLEQRVRLALSFLQPPHRRVDASH